MLCAHTLQGDSSWMQAEPPARLVGSAMPRALHRGDRKVAAAWLIPSSACPCGSGEITLFLCSLPQLIHGTVVDTAIVFPHRLGLPYKRALRTLMADYLKRIIQDNGETSEGPHCLLWSPQPCLSLLSPSPCSSSWCFLPCMVW